MALVLQHCANCNLFITMDVGYPCALWGALPVQLGSAPREGRTWGLRLRPRPGQSCSVMQPERAHGPTLGLGLCSCCLGLLNRVVGKGPAWWSQPCCRFFLAPSSLLLPLGKEHLLLTFIFLFL